MNTKKTNQDSQNRKACCPSLNYKHKASIIYHASRIVLGVVFIYASIDKIIHPQDFAQAVFNYQILPDDFINLIALILPWLELILGCCLILNRCVPGAVSISTGLLIVFMSAILFNILRGMDINCGCFSTNPQEGPMNSLTLIRDASFLIPAFYLVFFVYVRKKRE